MLAFDLDHTIRILSQTPQVLRHLIHGLDDEWLYANEGPDTWSPHEVVAHLIYGEQSDWIPRMRMILSDQEDKTFAPFDRAGHIVLMAGRSMEALLQEFEQWRHENLQILSGLHLQENDLNKTAQHPALGEVTLRQLLASWMVHDMTHLYQITRVVAVQYKEEAGPWKAFMRIINE